MNYYKDSDCELYTAQFDVNHAVYIDGQLQLINYIKKQIINFKDNLIRVNIKRILQQEFTICELDGRLKYITTSENEEHYYFDDLPLIVFKPSTNTVIENSLTNTIVVNILYYEFNHTFNKK